MTLREPGAAPGAAAGAPGRPLRRAPARMCPCLPACGGASGSRGGNPPCRRLARARVPAGGGRADERLCGCAGCRSRASGMPTGGDAGGDAGGRRAGWPTGGLSSSFLAHAQSLFDTASAETSQAAAGSVPLSAPAWPVRASPLTDVVLNTTADQLELPDAPGLKRLLDPKRPGAFLACRCGSERQEKYGSCIQRLYFLDPHLLTYTSHRAVRLLKAVKDKGVINMSRGVNSWRGRKKAKTEAGVDQGGQAEPEAASEAAVETFTDEDWRLSDRDTARRVREQFVKEATMRMMQPGLLGGAPRRSAKIFFHSARAASFPASPSTRRPQARRNKR